MKQRFSALVSIEFYEVSQETKLFVPQRPKRMDPLRRDTLYPFYLFGSDQQLDQFNQ
jgi:hypothetical protein